jgi:DNA polymerase elongation subunit (family B)
MYNIAYLKNCLFFDIETVGRCETFEQCEKQEPVVADIWLEKGSMMEKFKSDPKGFYETNAGLYPEYGKIICISFGYWDASEKKWKIETLDESNMTEREILFEFGKRLNTDFINHVISGYNIKNFDIPYVYRRMLTHKILPPPQIDNGEKKPWEVKAYDLYRAWTESSGIVGMCNFEMVCTLMGVPSSKGGSVKGKYVSKAYYEGRIQEISEYCERDVEASIKLAIELSVEKLQEPI